MTITELAKELKLSRQSVYNAVKNNGMSIDTLTAVTQGNKKELTAEGVKVIRQLVKNKPSTSNVNLTELQRKITVLTEQLKQAEIDNNKLSEDIKTLREELTRQREDNSILIKTIATQTITIQQQQQKIDSTGLINKIRLRLTSGKNKEKEIQ